MLFTLMQKKCILYLIDTRVTLKLFYLNILPNSHYILSWNFKMRTFKSPCALHAACTIILLEKLIVYFRGNYKLSSHSLVFWHMSTFSTTIFNSSTSLHLACRIPSIKHPGKIIHCVQYIEVSHLSNKLTCLCYNLHCFPSFSALILMERRITNVCMYVCVYVCRCVCA